MNNSELTALVVRHVGYAAPHVMNASIGALRNLGVKVEVLDTNVLQPDDYESVLANIKELKPSFALGYGATSHLYFVHEGKLHNIFEEINIPYVSWFMDSPFEPTCFKFICMSMAQPNNIIAVWDRYYMHELKSLGFKNVEYLPCCADAAIMTEYPMNPAYDVGFTGQWSLERECTLAQIADFCPVIMGDGWNQAQPDVRNMVAGFAPYEQVNRSFSACKVNINIVATQSIEALNLRFFDIAATGNFQIVKDRLEIKGMFHSADVEIATYKNIEDLRSTLHTTSRVWDMEDLKAYSKNLQHEVLRKHTYINRMDKLLEVVKAKIEKL